MSPTRLAAWLFSSAALLLAASCQSIAGIEEYELGVCGEYCDTVMANCTQENKVYADRNSCMGICRNLEQGDPSEPGTTNTVACRLAAARDAEPDDGDRRVFCQQAGPTGGDRCGSTTCETYCDLYANVCAAESAQNGCDKDCCLRTCPGLVDDNNYNTDDDYDGDTLQCRFVHLAASTVDPAKHCSHARLAKPNLHCSDDMLRPPKAPTCEAYCKLVTTVCSDENAVYESVAQCEAVCATLEELGFLGESGDTTTNTVACRRYHANNAISDPAGHCSHAGPGGAGHCMDDTDVDLGNCQTYCRLGAKLCADDFAASFADEEECMAGCVKLDGSQEDKAVNHYAVGSAEEDPAGFRCRLLELTRAAAKPSEASHCAAAFGAADPCGG